MYDPVQVRLNILRSPLPAATTTAPTDESGAVSQQEKRRPPLTITLPTSTLSAAAIAEAREYDDEDEDNMVEDEHADFVDDRRHASTSSRSAPGRGGKAKTVGVLEKNADTTYLMGK